MNRMFAMSVCLMSLSSFSMILTGCGGGGGGSGSGGGSGTSQATVLFSGGSGGAGARAFSFGDADTGNNPAEVNPADIESLTLTLTEIVFLYEGPDDGIDDDGDSEDVHVRASSFDPATVTIHQGESVRWEWEGNGLHTVTSGSAGAPDAGLLFDESKDTDGNIVEIVFNEVGTFPYFSDTDADIANAMTGTVVVTPDDDSDDDDNEDHSRSIRSGEDDDITPITVFTGAIDIDLVSLTLLDISSLITEVTLPAGEYKGMRLSIENPRLVLKSDPATVITDIRITGNGRLFVKHEFDLDVGEDALVTVHFGGIHLNETTPGTYVLLPRLSISDRDDSPEVEFDGVIASIAANRQSMVVDLDNGFTSITVRFTERTKIHAENSDVRLTVDDLAVNMQVEVEGTPNSDRSVTAKEVEIENERGEIEFNGVVASVASDGSSMVIDLVRRSVAVTVLLNDDTFIHNHGFETPLTAAALTPGKVVKVDGTPNGDGTITAKEVEIRVQDEFTDIEFHGIIASIATDGLSMEVEVVDGFVSIPVVLNGSTFIYEEKSNVALTVADLEVGMQVEVEGTSNNNGSVTAVKVKIENERD